MAIYGYQADRSYQAHSLVGRCCGSDEHSCKRRQNDIDQVMPSKKSDAGEDLACSSGVASEASSMRSPRKTIVDGVKTDNTHLASTNRHHHQYLAKSLPDRFPALSKSLSDLATCMKVKGNDRSPIV